MDTRDFPGLYQAADCASVRAQKYYLTIIGLDLVFMILGAILAVHNFESTSTNLIIYIISGLFLLTSLILTIVLKYKAYEGTWYQGRALAESVKTLTWRYCTCSELFEETQSKEDVNHTFVERIRELANEFRELNKILDANVVSRSVISNRMESLRGLSVDERKSIYIHERIADQKKWYSNKATFNKKKYDFWFLVIVIAQFFSVVTIVPLIRDPSLNWNLVGLFTTISGVAISWLQLKQHQELKQAYTTAAQELNFIEASSKSVHTENELSQFVLDSENAISREHTLWLAQKRS